MAYAWTKSTPETLTRNISKDQRIYFISDLHLGDGTRSDSFVKKDKELIELLHQIRKEQAHLVIVGDAIDFHQAWSIERVIKAHAILIKELSQLAQQKKVTYVWGNHDHDISDFRDVLHFEVCSDLTIDDLALIQHGYQYDPYIGEDLEGSHVVTKLHHAVERIFDTWIRLPLENFYNIENRLAFWVFHKFALAVQARTTILKKLGFKKSDQSWERFIQYWAMNQIADPAGIFENVRTKLEESDFKYLITGHSHLPGKVPIGEKFYINTGSWTFNSAQYALWDGKQFTVRDWISNKEYQDAAYRPLLDRRFRHMNFLAWWRENYIGWFQFRVGETGRNNNIWSMGDK